MELGPLLEQALMLMLTGMSVVFVFLSILIFLVRQLARFGDPTQPTPASSVASTPVKAQPGTSPDVIAAITVAVQQYRQRQR
ncbi:OadG family protein [Salinivibrio proteolyticus]|uniref:Probable oxaloacetate decarboxylase gamma chain n=1 Tax=Salinivibrio proteolyticus TaxID=334715 RepID=A0ABY7LDI4_9GAMM|nr:OadG family transporter subunit [Salinivibrio proteolyticus]WBA15302.1 OadG family transporter subunit [Salinivibrio proteolyticus]